MGVISHWEAKKECFPLPSDEVKSVDSPLIRDFFTLL